MSSRTDRKLLAIRYPLTFSPTGGKHQKRPLKIGIIEDLIQRGVFDADGWALTPDRIHAAVNSYKAGPRYTKAIAKGGPRYDLDGQPCGYVSERHRAEAQRKVDAMGVDYSADGVAA